MSFNLRGAVLANVSGNSQDDYKKQSSMQFKAVKKNASRSWRFI